VQIVNLGFGQSLLRRDLQAGQPDKLALCQHLKGEDNMIAQMGGMMGAMWLYWLLGVIVLILLIVLLVKIIRKT
jgi:hypothetical protein